MSLAQRSFTVIHITIHILDQLIKFRYLYEQEIHSHKIFITVFLKIRIVISRGKQKIIDTGNSKSCTQTSQS